MEGIFYVIPAVITIYRMKKYIVYYISRSAIIMTLVQQPIYSEFKDHRLLVVYLLGLLIWKKKINKSKFEILEYLNIILFTVNNQIRTSANCT